MILRNLIEYSMDSLRIYSNAVQRKALHQQIYPGYNITWSSSSNEF